MNLQTIHNLCFYFFIYGFLGWCVEVAFHAIKVNKFVNRGFLNGPICPIYGVGVCIVISLLTPYKDNLILLYITSTILVTALEYVTGWVLEKVFHNKWWDYSNMPLNIKGYVCLIFSLAWGVGCVIIVDFVHPLFQLVVTHIPMVLGMVMIVILGLVMFADLYVTAAAIFKMNAKLARMDEIARELHKISDEIGENIYKETIEAMKKQEGAAARFSIAREETTAKFTAAKEETTAKISAAREETTVKINAAKEETTAKLTAAKEETAARITAMAGLSVEMRQRIEKLYRGYRENTDQSSAIQKRIVRAFPKMKSNKYTEGLENLRQRYIELRIQKKDLKNRSKEGGDKK